MSPVAYTSSTAPDKEEKKPLVDPVYKMTNASKGRAPDSQAALEDLTRRVREQSDKIQRMLTPYADTLKVFAEARPVLFTWLAIFAFLSTIPILCSIGFVLAASTFMISTALFFLSACIIGTVLLSTACLVPVLVFTSILASSAVGVLLGLFLAHRLFLHVRAATTEQSLSIASASEGVRSWVEETTARVGLGAGEYHAPFSDAVDSVADDVKDIKARFSAASPAKDKVHAEKPSHAEDAITPTLKPASFNFPQMKTEPQDMFSPPQVGKAVVDSSPSDSRDSVWTSDDEPK